MFMLLNNNIYSLFVWLMFHLLFESPNILQNDMKVLGVFCYSIKTICV